MNYNSEITATIDKIKAKSKEIEEWIRSRRNHTRTIYSSIDVRFSGFKCSPVDTNIFPGGFNNLSSDALELAQLTFANHIKSFDQKISNILLIAESFTRNQGYIQNIEAILSMLRNFDVRVLTFKEVTFADHSINDLSIDHNGIMKLPNWNIDLALLNTDLSGGVPNILQNIKQTILPDIKHGWHQRKKSDHFSLYNRLVKEFCRLFNIDPWLLSTNISVMNNIDFKSKTGFNKLADAIQKSLDEISIEYKNRSINAKPAVFVKSEHGTFGIGITKISNTQELYDMNKKSRNSMHTIQSGIKNSKIVIQEAIPTVYTADSKPFENSFYFVFNKQVGHISRANFIKSNVENLNSKGMYFINNKHYSEIESLVARIADLTISHE